MVTGSASTEGRDTARGGAPTFVIFALYFLLAVCLTWPLVTSIASPPATATVPAGAHDVWQNYWNFWWWKTAILERHQSPYSTDMIFHPIFKDDPAKLGCHTHSPANILLTLPVSATLGVPAALNLAIFAGFLFAGFGLYLLAREYTANRWAAFIGGIVFAYFPQHVEQSLEHLNLASIHAMPLFLWALIRLIRRGGWVWCSLTGAFFALNALFSWHNGLLILPVGVAVGIFEILQARRSVVPTLIGVVVAGCLATLLVSPFLYELLHTVSEGAAGYRKATVPKPIDPLFLLIPHSGHPIWGTAVSGFYEKFRSYPSVGFVAYLGVSALALAFFALFYDAKARVNDEGSDGRPARTAWLMLTVFLFFLVLALGEVLRVAGHEISSVHLPFQWLKSLPIFGLVRVPNRFLVPAVLALAVLVALGTSALAALIPRRGRTAFLAAITTVVVLDFLWVPFPVREVVRPEWLHLLDDYDRDLVVLDIPSGHTARASEDMLLQTFHRHPIASGYTATKLAKVTALLEQYPVLRRIFERYPPEESRRGPSLAAAIRALEIDLVVVHLDRTVTRILERRDEARQHEKNDLYRLRLFSPEVGIDDAALLRFREELVGAFGEPVAIFGADVEIFRID